MALVIDVQNIDIDGLIKIIDVRTFATEEEFNGLLRDFYNQQRENIRTELEEKNQRIEKLKQTNCKLQIKKEYNEVMECIDEITLQRKLYIDKVTKKHKYKGRYHYGKNKNTSGKTRNGSNKRCGEGKTYKQLCIMSQGGEPLFR